MSAVEDFGQPMAMLTFALDYARRGIPVFPCRQDNKRPLTLNGHTDATTDAKQIREWWTTWPNAMIGAPAGRRSGFWVLDPDAPKKPGNPDGRAAWAELQMRHGKPPATHTVNTPGGGRHLLFKWDDARPVTNSAGALKGTGIDVRGAGGYAIMAMSVNAGGNAYTIEEPLDQFKFADAPDWLYGIILAEPEPEPAPERPEPGPESISERAKAKASIFPPKEPNPFFKKVNELAMQNIAAWAPSAFPNGKWHGDAWRVSSKALGRDLEEDLSISAGGIKDWGVWDMGDPRGGKRSAAFLLVEHGIASTPADAAHWLCGKLGVDPGALGWEDEPRRQNGGESDSNSGRDEFAAEPAEPVDPVDLWSEFVPPALRRGLLPDVIERFAFDQGMLVGSDPSGFAMGAIAVCAGAIPDSVQLQMKRHDPHWLMPARLWVVLIGPPSAKKSPIMRATCGPLRRINSRMSEAYQVAKAAYDRLEKEERKTTPPPKNLRCVINDVTVEAAQEILKDSPEGVFSEQDELTAWFASNDKYSSERGAGKDRGFWLRSFDGGSYSFDRVSRGSVEIPNLSVSLLGGIQPDPMKKIARDSVDDGLLQRFLPIVLRGASVGKDEPPSGSAEDYATLINRLHNIGGGFLGGEMPGTLHFDDDALKIRADMSDKHHKLVEVLERTNPKLSFHFGKYDGIFGRLCVVWHCVEHAGGAIPEIVSADTAQRVATFMHTFLKPHAWGFYNEVLETQSDHDLVVDAAGYILAHEIGTLSEGLFSRASTGMKRAKAEDRAGQVLRSLADYGWGEMLPARRRTDPPVLVVNPEVHRKFAKVAERERAQREATRELIAENGRAAGRKAG